MQIVLNLINTYKYITGTLINGPLRLSKGVKMSRVREGSGSVRGRVRRCKLVRGRGKVSEGRC